MGTAEPSGIPVAFGGTEDAVAESGQLLAEPGVTVAESGAIAAPAGGTVERLSGTGIFGEELKAQRRKRGWTQVELASEIGYSGSYLSDLERGERSATLDLATRFDQAFDLPGTFVRLYAIVKRAPEFPEWFESIVVPYEGKATRINGWELGTVPGLLQTEDYARAFIQVSRPDLPDTEIERLVKVRISRQDIFTSPTPPKLWYVIDESAFRRRFGGAKIMAMQVNRLMTLASVPGNVIQVLTFSASEDIGASGPIVVYEFKDRPMVGYAECYRGGRLAQDAEESEEMLTKLNLIRMHALSPRESVAWMRTLRSELTDE
jgi:transcriptional regulator with XRE-family HTH domain